MLKFAFLLVFITWVKTDDESDRAVQYKNMEQMINNFTFNWTLKAPEINSERKNQLTLLTQPGSYQGRGGDDYFTESATQGTMKQLISNFPASPPFKNKLLQAADQCDFYIDQEIEYRAPNLTIRKLGFMRLKANVDKFIYMYTWTTFELVKISKDTNQFLACAAKFEADESQCRLPSQLSKFDWIGFKIWFEAYTTIQFMDDASNWRQQILRTLNQLLPHLPPDYRPSDRCQMWPPTKSDCDEVNNPKLSIAITQVNTWKYEPLTFGERLLVRPMIFREKGTPETPTINCGLDPGHVLDLFKSWLSNGYVDQDFVTELNRLITKKSGQDFYAVRDLIFTAGWSKVNFARILIISDPVTSKYHMGAIFYNIQLIGLVPSKSPSPCDPEEVMCTDDKIALLVNDGLFKRYIIEKSVDAFKNVKKLVKFEKVIENE